MTTSTQPQDAAPPGPEAPETPARRAARLIAFYLPQFYPTPENDAWWGRGFTEWTNVAKARPLFPGHDQPRLPADLGFYDLRVPETRAAQADLARGHGIEGFCYWHYWFEGRRILDRPFDEVLRSGEPDFPFCLGWANHTWSRRWTGEDKEVLVKQTYSAEDDLNHARWLTHAFADQRYIRVNGRPLFLLYNPYDLPDARRTIDTFRNECVRHGLPEPYIVGSNLTDPERDPRSVGCDMVLNAQPRLALLKGAFYDKFSRSRFARNAVRRIADGNLKVYDYAAAMETVLSEPPKNAFWPTVPVGWDTTARRGRKAIIFADANPEVFKAKLGEAIHAQAHVADEERFVFINAWNEWGEGMYLEPDTKNGMRFLEAVRDVVCVG